MEDRPMKNILISTVCMMAASLAVASSNFRGDDFNNMIQENQKAESDLRNQLQKEAGIRFDDKPGTISRDKYAPKGEVEQIVVSTTEPKSNSRKHRASTYNKLDETTAAKRLSQEFKEAN
jgi:hypothetical protein